MNRATRRHGGHAGEKHATKRRAIQRHVEHAAMVTVVLLMFAGFAVAREVRLNAHRGGIVDGQHIENNLPAIEEAVRRGYWMLEVDVRESKDGHLVVHHDDNFRRFYNDPRRVDEMTWDEIAVLRSKPGGLRPLDFDEYAKACSGKRPIRFQS